MASFLYKLEFVYDGTSAADASVFVQMRDNPPIYQRRIRKEDYDVLSEEEKDDFLTHLFAFAGVVEVSAGAYRLWMMKSPVYSWEEVLTPIMYYLTSYFGYDDFRPMAGSGNLDGTGFSLDSITQRRDV